MLLPFLRVRSHAADIPLRLFQGKGTCAKTPFWRPPFYATPNVGAEVDEVVVENGRAVGVRMGNGEVKTADVVIVNADLPGAYRRLLRNADASIPSSKLEASGPTTQPFLSGYS